VYATDVTPVRDRVLAFELPDDAQPAIEYQVAIVTDAADDEAARAFVDSLRGETGRTALAAAGFGLP
jgi:molybdate transport system substrate-binding protein